MASYDTSPYPMLDDEPGSAHRLRQIIVTLCSITFIAGGFFFGFVFVARVEGALGIAGQRILGVALPADLRTVISVPRLPDLSFVPALIQPMEPTDTPTWAGADRVNILLLGVDQRPDEKGQPTRTDTMIIASIDPVHKTGAMVSIPRDMWVPIPVDSKRPIEDKITAAHFYGDYFHFPGGGPALAKKTIEYNLGIHVNYYAKVDFDGFEQIVDTLGGVSVCVERPLVDNEYPTRDYGYMRVFIPAGLQLLDGEHALQYARSRHQDSDFGRIRRQQQVLLAIREKALRLEILPKLPQLVQQLGGSIETDLSPVQILMLAQLASQIDRSGIVNVALDGDAVRPFVTSGGADALLPIRSQIEKVVSRVLYDPAQVDPSTDEVGAPETTEAIAPAVAPPAASQSLPTSPAPSKPTPAAAGSC